MFLRFWLSVVFFFSRDRRLRLDKRSKKQQVDVLKHSIDISNDLFKSARADYLAVLMTQRDALESKLQLIETRKDQLITRTNIYRNLGGGWK